MIQAMRDPLHKWGEEAKTADENTVSLGNAVNALPTSKTVDIQVDTATAQQTLQAFADQWMKGITVPVSVDPGAATPGSHAPGQNPLDAFAGGSSGGLLPQASALKDRYAGQGFTNIGGYSATVDQPWDEHQTGTAIDVPIPNWQGAGSGSGIGVVTDALRQPGTQHVIWRQQIS